MTRRREPGDEPKNPLTDNPPPSSIEHERAVLGAALLGAIDTVADALTPSHFYLDKHQRLFAAMLELHHRDQAVDVLTMKDALKERGDLEDIGGPGLLVELSEEAGTAANLPAYITIVRDRWVARESIKLLANSISGLYNGKARDQLIDMASKVDALVSVDAPTEDRIGSAMQFENAGSEYVARWPRYRVVMTLRRLRDHSETMKGELLVESNGRRLEMLTYSISAGTSRTALAKSLHEADPRLRKELWSDMLKVFGFRVSDAQRHLAAELLTGELYAGLRFEVFPFTLRNMVAILYAPPGHAKSLLAVACGLAYASGQVLPGGIRPSNLGVQGKVLFLDSETDKASFNHRVGALCRGFDMDVPEPEFLHYINVRGKVLSDIADQLRAYVVRHGIGLVILDSTLPVAGADREYSDAAMNTFNAVAGMGVSALMTSHTAKGGDAETPYGSMWFEAGPRLALPIKRLAQTEHGLTVQVASRKGNDVKVPPMLFAIEFDPDESYTWIRITAGQDDVEGEDGVEEPGTGLERILLVLRPGVELTPKEIALQTGIPRSSVNTLLGRGESRGLVEPCGRGRWRAKKSGGNGPDSTVSF